MAASVTAADQLTKAWALAALDDRTIHLWWTLRLRLVFNRGAAFSLGAELGPLIALVGVAVVLVLLRTARLAEGVAPRLALGLVVGGALGNLVDRVARDGGLLRGAVVDFIDLQWWPVFNLADAAIVVGAALLLVTARRG